MTAKHDPARLDASTGLGESMARPIPGTGMRADARTPGTTAARTGAVSRPVRTRFLIAVGGFGALACVTCVLAPLVGSTHINLLRAFDRSIPFADNVDAQIFFVARMPRVLTAAVVGGTLAAAGVVMQALLRNPLATPFTLGVSAGAAPGAILEIGRATG